MEESAPPWQALLIGGASGSGKTIAAEALGKRFGVSWVQVDDLRLTLQYGGLLIPEQHPELFFFLQHEDFRSLAPALALEQQIAVARLITPAINIVIDHHLATGKPIILEGDGILPSLAAERLGGAVRAVFLVETTADDLYRNMVARGRGIGADETTDPDTAAKRRAWIEHTWRYNQWLAQEARRCGMPTVQSRPWETLIERILAAVVRKL